MKRRRLVRRWAVLGMLALAAVLVFPTAGRKLEGLATWLFLVMRSPGLEALGERLDPLWGARDLAWTGLLGLLAPAAVWFLLTHWLPTGGREFGPRLTVFLVPGLALMALFFAVLVPLFERQERAWVARDELMRTDPERPAMTGYEWEITRVARDELLDILR